MSYSVVTLLDDNIAIERQRTTNILGDSVVNRIAYDNVIQLYSENAITNNNNVAQFCRNYNNKSVSLRQNSDDLLPITPESFTFDSNAQLLSVYQNKTVIISSQ
jgi:hypothetical protein